MNDPIVTATTLSKWVRVGQVTVLDCRFDLGRPDWGRSEYANAHVPGAQYVDLDRDLADLAREGCGRHPLPDAKSFHRTMERWDVRPERPVVAYDQGSGGIAARAWWLLRNAGHQAVFVLDGGWAAWQADNLDIVTGAADHLDPAQSGLKWRWDVMPSVDTAGLQRGLKEDQLMLVDARSQERFEGVHEPIDPIAGHIPEAVNQPFENNLKNGRWKSVSALRSSWQEILIDAGERDIAHSCGSGVTACANVLALDRIGLSSTLYWPSFSGWISDPTRPVVSQSKQPD